MPDLYILLGVTLPGKVAVKVHSGEKGNQNFLKPDFRKPIIEFINVCHGEREYELIEA